MILGIGSIEDMLFENILKHVKYLTKTKAKIQKTIKKKKKMLWPSEKSSPYHRNLPIFIILTSVLYDGYAG